MPLAVILHDVTQPALFAAAAAIAASSLGGRLLYLQPRFDLARYPDAEQHVGADRLLPSGLIWQARMNAACEAPSSPDELLQAAQEEQVVTPWHPAWHDESVLESLMAKAKERGIGCRIITAKGDSERWYFENDELNLGTWERDRYGRPTRIGATSTSVSNTYHLAIALMGTTHDQRNTYPANLAALGDAADALGITLDIECIGAPDFSEEALNSVDGIVLPGGASMHNVAGQICTAQHAMRQDTPLAGLCLGMQSLTTAIARTLAGGENINLAEAEPDAPIKSFVPMQGFEGLPAFRVGVQRTIALPEQSESLNLGGLSEVHYNHRFMLNPELRTPLHEAGLRVIATDPSGQIVDAVKLDHHPFFAGMQGHPELASRPSAPHPLLMAFLRAIIKAQE